MGKLWGAKWPDEENGKLGPRWCNGALIWGAFWWRNGQIRDPSDDEIGALWWPDGEIWGTRPLILFKRFNTAPLHSFKFMGPKFLLRNFGCHTSWKRIHGALNLHCSSYISKIVWWLSMFDFGIFCHLLRLMRIYRVGVRPVWVFEKFRSLFSFLPFLFSSFFPSFSIFPSLSGAPLAPGPLDIVHPCHPVTTPLPTDRQTTARQTHTHR